MFDICIENKIVEMMHPCGTPALINCVFDVDLLLFTKKNYVCNEVNNTVN
jgi:hypothetical protein